jgi:hypothetical protein
LGLLDVILCTDNRHMVKKAELSLAASVSINRATLVAYQESAVFIVITIRTSNLTLNKAGNVLIT